MQHMSWPATPRSDDDEWQVITRPEASEAADAGMSDPPFDTSRPICDGDASIGDITLNASCYEAGCICTKNGAEVERCTTPNDDCGLLVVDGGWHINCCTFEL